MVCTVDQDPFDTAAPGFAGRTPEFVECPDCRTIFIELLDDPDDHILLTDPHDLTQYLELATSGSQCCPQCGGLWYPIGYPASGTDASWWRRLMGELSYRASDGSSTHAGFDQTRRRLARLTIDEVKASAWSPLALTQA